MASSQASVLQGGREESPAITPRYLCRSRSRNRSRIRRITTAVIKMLES